MTGHASTSVVQTRVEIRTVAGPFTSPCEVWQGYVDRQGYPVIGRAYKSALRLHRMLWDAEHGSESRTGMVVHHRCENKRCLNIEHMELVTPAEHARIHHAAPEADVQVALTLHQLGWTQRRIAAYLRCSKSVVGKWIRNAGGGDRTPTRSRVPDLESGASTSSATPAQRHRTALRKGRFLDTDNRPTRMET